MIRSLLASLIAALVICAVCVVAAFAYYQWSIERPLSPGDQTYVIERGQSVRHLAQTLRERGVIKEAYSLVVLARVEGVASQIKAGEFRFEEGTNLRSILKQTVKGAVVDYALTILEGWTFAQMRQAIADAEKIKHTLTELSDTEVMARLGLTDKHPEGLFFPDTYRYIEGQTDLSLLEQAHERMQHVLNAAWEERQKDLPVENPYQALILASIIEKETGQADERAQIAGVFINRLRKGMLLQTDPTVIYGLGAEFDGNLTREHLKTDTPYNTYTRTGLPPTPIALPSAAAVKAALNPADTKALYFVSRGDGSHVFSETLSQHNRAVRKFQLKSDS